LEKPVGAVNGAVGPGRLGATAAGGGNQGQREEDGEGS
jgi:hypothetical protein